MGIKEIITSPRSPWQNGHVERFIGSIRRDCLDHVIVFSENHLRRILTEYFAYYNLDRTHYNIAKDTPIPRAIQARLEDGGKVVTLPRVGGLHHRYEWRRAA
jgi:transposase InsO family protein